MPTKKAGAREVIAGEISLAHHGVLCLDELPEFNRVAIEGLRQPMESGVVHLARAGYTANLPAKCIISATANPCPCGHYANQHRTCICTPGSVRHYRKRLSGPILERFGIHLDTGGAPPDVDGSSKATLWTDTEYARKMIQLVRLRWQQFPDTPTTERSPEMWHVIKEFSAVTHWSYRSQLAVARLAQTLAWMRDPDLPWGLLAVDAAAEACEFRIFDRSGWFDAHRHPSIPQTHA
jgi:magnesium chelatase family protein